MSIFVKISIFHDNYLCLIGLSIRMKSTKNIIRLESRYLDKNSTGLDMLDQVIWQPPGRFKLSLAEEFFRLVAIMS